MSSPGQQEQDFPVNEFRGESGAECESFIKSIRKTAWKEGKARDALWMADFASIHFSKEALKWHSALPLDARQDWFKQEMALLERWPPPADESDNEEAEAAIIPTPAAASLLSTPAAGKSSDIGVVQFVPISGPQQSIYISRLTPHGQCKLTTKVREAVRLRWDGSVDSGCGVLERLDSGRKWLAIHWTEEKPSFTQDSTTWARLTVVDPDTWSPATLGGKLSIPTRGPFRIKVWKLLSEGQIMPFWKDGIKEIQLEVFKTEDYMFFTINGDEYQETVPNVIRGRLVFRPIE